MQHVHGLGVNPTDGDSYVATHTGVFRVDEDRDPVRVADRFQDTMGFTVIGPDEFLGSGHPDLSERDLPTHLGLVSSSDAAETWRLESLAGRADFHALDAAAGRVVGYDALSETVLSSRDRTEWEQVAGGTVLDVAVDPSGVRVLATSPGGRLAELVDGAKRFLPAAPPAVLVDWPRPEELVTVDAEGQVQVSSDSGASWKKTGTPQGPPQAFDAGPGPWLLATEDDVLTSTDQGRTWSLVAPLH